ncbi:eotaxin [Pangasianodon hypophthalmus]|uniref:eotaxin n=1 Tax=Pangasianodon hypophthalmus TaxID=310915 RepID=UPI00230705C8|nr:eotaxin [Pangasianodon hypophthalmus]
MPQHTHTPLCKSSQRGKKRGKDGYNIMAVLKIPTGTFLFILILSAFITDTETARCCFSYTRRPVRCARLLGYFIQEITGNCDIRAIIFKTRDERLICADPRMEWTQERITCLWEKAGTMEYWKNGMNEGWMKLA